jgi:glycosyltransferase involved in cell wall biosynthesis
MPATDSAPPKTEWLYTFCNADMVVPYTQWAKKTLQISCGNQIKLFPKIANAGINPDEFYPIENKSEHKKKHFGEDIHVIGTVMRNQRRKLLPDLMIAYKKYIEILKQSNNKDIADKTYLYLHTSYPEDAGWDIPALLLEYGIADRTYFTYHCKNCSEWYPAKFQQSIAVCKHCGEKAAGIASPVNGIPTSQLNEVYNLFDLFIQYAICEGFGMPQIEAAACGITLASVDYSAMSEIIDNLGGYKIPVSRSFREMETNADRVYPDIDKTVEIMYDFFINLSENDRIHNSQLIREKCISYYTWDNTYKVWEECFDTIDINSKVSWQTKNINQTNHGLKVPKELTDKEFIQFICMNVVNDPSIMDTSHIQCLIRDAVSGMVAKPGSITTINRNYLVDKLEGFLNNKIMCEKMRLDNNTIIKEDFIK